MRPHKAKPDTDETMLKRLASLSEEKQEHFKMIVRLVAACYDTDTEKPPSGVLLVRDAGQLAVVSINANDLDIADIVANASTVVQSVVLEDAPPRELFN